MVSGVSIVTYLITEKNPNKKYYFIIEKNIFKKSKFLKKWRFWKNLDFSKFTFNVFNWFFKIIMFSYFFWNHFFENIFLYDEKLFFVRIFFCDQVCISSELSESSFHISAHLEESAKKNIFFVWRVSECSELSPVHPTILVR